MEALLSPVLLETVQLLKKLVQLSSPLSARNTYILTQLKVKSKLTCLAPMSHNALFLSALS